MEIYRSMIRYINLCNYSYELNLDCQRHACIYGYTDENRKLDSVVIKCRIMEYGELMEFMKSQLYIPDLKVFSGGGGKYYINVVRELGIIIYSLIEENITYISEVNGKIRKSSGYMIFTILKNHLNRYIFSNGQIPIHAALLCSDKLQNKVGFIILGESGVGKSTLCYRIHQDLGYDIYSDDLIVFDPVKKEIYGYCQQLFLKEDIVQQYGLERICEYRDGKYGITVENIELKGIKQTRIIYLKKNTGIQIITPEDLNSYIMEDAKCWCKMRKEDELYRKIRDLFNSAQIIISGSYLCADQILEVLKDE